MSAGPRKVAAAAAFVLLSVGCSDPVAGAPAVPVTGPSVPSGGDGASGTRQILDRLPSNAATRTDIALIDAAAMNRVALRTGYGASADSTDSAGRPTTQTGWLDLIAVQNTCGKTLDGPSNPLRSGPAGDSLSIELGTQGSSGQLAACAGAAVDSKNLSDSTHRGGEVTQRTIAGVIGYAANGNWIGSSGDRSFTFVAEDGCPADLVQAAIAGKPMTSGSLSQDPGVRAVLDTAPQAAMIEMGTTLLTSPRAAAPAPMRTAFETAVAQGGFQDPPVPEFGGYSWTPGTRYTGTALFVTTYGSPQEAATVVTILKDVWTRLGPSKFEGAQTEQHGTTVTTRITDIGPKEFEVQNGVMADYPAFLDRD